eukprot:TRINITY_DN2155_c1_g1_i1.p1 TRINITY_DN2155_c1_g1~~TRINITY_DN2155_c1_g1_i1.p1  ORF type:complete len:165 (-),score=50.19 TRINITY_DN2155_c1_g1_i1:718-1212(-)
MRKENVFLSHIFRLKSVWATVLMSVEDEQVMDELEIDEYELSELLNELHLERRPEWDVKTTIDVISQEWNWKQQLKSTMPLALSCSGVNAVPMKFEKKRFSGLNIEGIKLFKKVKKEIVSRDLAVGVRKFNHDQNKFCAVLLVFPGFETPAIELMTDLRWRLKQ